MGHTMFCRRRRRSADIAGHRQNLMISSTKKVPVKKKLQKSDEQFESKEEGEKKFVFFKAAKS